MKDGLAIMVAALRALKAEDALRAARHHHRAER